MKDADTKQRRGERDDSIWRQATGRDGDRPSSAPAREPKTITRRQERKPRRS